jgi:hypothetical protein
MDITRAELLLLIFTQFLFACSFSVKPSFMFSSLAFCSMFVHGSLLCCHFNNFTMLAAIVRHNSEVLLLLTQLTIVQLTRVIKYFFKEVIINVCNKTRVLLSSMSKV